MTTLYRNSLAKDKAINNPFLKTKISPKVIEKVIEEEEETSIKYLFQINRSFSNCFFFL